MLTTTQPMGPGLIGRLRHQVRYRRALRSLVAPSVPDPDYHSRFGGLWVDRRDAASEIDRRAESRAISEMDAKQLRHWVEHGYAILPGAVGAEICDALRADLDRAFDQGDERLLMTSPAVDGLQPLRAGVDTERARVVDAYVYYDPARRALFSDAIVRFLRIVFDDDPVLFQSLTFERGSQQRMHQDTAFVVTTSPLELAASWIALEDIYPGSGELTYLDGSHRLPEYLFSGKYKHWNAKRDGDEQQSKWRELIYRNAERMGLEQKTFLPRKGDALVWSADLAHGGSPVTDRSLTRKSLVGHYCPGRVDPFYFRTDPERRRKRPFGGAFYASQYYRVGA
jgi:ectoine hydroxylase-related dioxygenase (phytanoyl-CoA dioxygenase family)